MRTPALFVLAVVPLFAIDGTVTNGTTGKPQPNVMVNVIAAGEGGMRPVGSAKTDENGKFRIDAAPRGAHLVQAIYAGVPYNKMIDPNAPATGLQINVYDPTTDPASAKISQHIIFLQPASEQISVNEVFFVDNTTNKTFNDTANGSLRFYVGGRAADEGGLRVSISTPGGMPVNRTAEPAGRPGVYKVNYPVKPGETQFTISYTLPGADKFAGRSLDKTDTRLVVPKGVSLQGPGLRELGDDPSGKAVLYTVSGAEFSVDIAGAPTGGAMSRDAQDEEDTGQPGITAVRPRLYAQLPVVLALAFAVLLLGFVILFRAARGPGSEGKPRR